MRLVSLKIVVRVGRRVLVVEPGDQADVQNVVCHPVDEAAAERLVRQRESERVNDHPGRHRARFAPPNLFHASRVRHRIAILVERQFRDRLLGEGSPRALGENHDFRHEIGAGFVIRFRFAVVVDSFIADAHADDARIVPQQLLSRKRWKDVGAEFLCDTAHPFRQLLQTRDVLAVIFHHRRHERTWDGKLPGVRHVPHRVARHRRLERRLLAPIGQQFVKAFRIDDRTGNSVIADVAALLDQHHREVVFAALLRELAQANRRGEAGRSAPDDENVDVQLIAFSHNSRHFRARGAEPWSLLGGSPWRTRRKILCSSV